jgi:DNA-binding transcriptional LysR family regulator
MNPVDPLSCLPTFVAVVRAGSFTLAAERLGLTKSAVGKRIARLEAHLGLPLLQRAGRRLHLTDEGRSYFETCSALLEQLAATEAELSPRARALKGRVRLDMPVAFGRRIVLPHLLALTQQHPELLLTMRLDDATVALPSDEVDIAIRFGALDDSMQRVARRISRQTRLICASPDYLARHGRPTHPAELEGHRCIVGTSSGPPGSWILREDGNEFRFTPLASHQFNDGEALIDAALAGFGLCQMPSSLLHRHIDRGELVPVLERFTGTPVDVHVLWARQATRSPRVRFIVDQLVALGERGLLDGRDQSPVMRAGASSAKSSTIS